MSSRSCTAITICVPTPLSKAQAPDISAIVAASEAIARRLRPGQLIVLESTTYPGTTEEVVLPKLAAGGLCVGHDFYLAFAPERIDPGKDPGGDDKRGGLDGYVSGRRGL